MTKREIISRFCALAEKVAIEAPSIGWEDPHDCFCGQNLMSKEESFRFSEEIMKLIESAVEDKLFNLKI